VIPANGGAEQVLAAGYDVRQLRWNADGTAISYVSAPDSSQNGRYVVYRVAVSGGQPRMLHDAGIPDDAPRIMDDGRLMFPGPSLLDWTARTVKDASGKVFGTLTMPVDTWEDGSTGDYRTVALRESRPRALRLVEIASGRSHVLVDTTAEASSMAWFADGQRVAALVRRNGAYALGVFNTAGRELKSVPLKEAPRFQPTLDNRWHSELTVSPNGRYAAYIGFGRASLELVDITTGEQRTLAKSTLTVTSPVWRPDSRALRYVRDGALRLANSTRSVSEVSVDGADRVVQLLPFSEFPGAAVPMISYDMVANLGANATALTIIRLDGRPPLVLPPTAHGWPMLSPDQATLMIRVGVPGGIGTVTEPRRVLLFSLSDMSSRHLLLPENEPHFITGEWSPDGKNFYLTGRSSRADPVNIYSVPVDGSTPRRVARVNTREPSSMFAVSPDGKYVVFAEGGLQRATFLKMDFTEGVSRLLPSARHE
jgi:Tol biopolymer transport system component